jgi:hypothetical protein
VNSVGKSCKILKNAALWDMTPYCSFKNRRSDPAILAKATNS